MIDETTKSATPMTQEKYEIVRAMVSAMRVNVPRNLAGQPVRNVGVWEMAQRLYEAGYRVASGTSACPHCGIDVPHQHFIDSKGYAHPVKSNAR